MNKLVVIFACLLLTACSGDRESNAGQVQQNVNGDKQVVRQNAAFFRSIEPVEASNLIKKESELLILDVRSAHELKEGKIKDSVLAPLWDIVKGRYQVPAGQPILIVCAIGGRSYAIGQYLSKKGYQQIYNLKGGISGWKEAGLPLVY